MIHLSRFLVGVRHTRVFRFRNTAGYLIDHFIKELPGSFDKANETAPGDEFLLENKEGTLIATLNRDDFAIESRKIYDYESDTYWEVRKSDLLSIVEKSLPFVSSTLNLKNDYSRIGMIFDFRIPVWDGLTENDIGKFICEKFINFSTGAEVYEGELRFVYKIQFAPSSGLKDFRNVIIRIMQDNGIDEQGEKKKCILVSIDIQRIFDPARKDVDVKDHFSFAQKHLTEVIFPQLKVKGLEIRYE